MSSRIYVSTIEASYFETHILGCSASPPVEGNHTIGDIYISSIQQDDIFGWVCTKAGNPGVWKIICDVTMIKNNIQEHTNNINKLLEFMEETEGKIDGIHTKNDNQDKQINQILRDIVSLNELVTESDGSLIEAVHANTEEIQKLAVEVANNKQGVNKNKEDIVNINDRINNINNSMNTVSSQVITNTSEINKLKGELEDMTDLMDGSLTDIEGLLKLQNNVNSNTEAIRKLEEGMENIEGDMTNIQQNIDDLVEITGDNTEEITELRKDVDDLQGFVDTNSKGIVNIQNDISDLRDQMTANSDEIADLKQGLVDALVNKGVNVNKNTNWLDLFKALLNELGKTEDPEEPEEPVDPDPEEPEEPEIVECTSISFSKSSVDVYVNESVDLKPFLTIKPDNCTDEVTWIADNTLVIINDGVVTGKAEGSIKVQARCSGLSANIAVNIHTLNEPGDPEEGIVLFKNGVIYENTNFAKICYPRDRYDILNDDLIIGLGKIGDGGSHTWFSFDGYVDFNNYDRVEITLRTQRSTQQPYLGIARTMQSGQYGYMAAADWTREELHSKLIMTTTTETTHSFNINEMVGSNSAVKDGYLLIWLNGGESTETGNIFISKIVVYPKEDSIPTPVEKPCTAIYFREATGLKVTGSETLNLNVLLVVQPEGCTDKVTWMTDSNAVSVTDGIVTVLGGGFAKVQARCGNYAATVSVEAILEVAGGISLYANGDRNYNTPFMDYSLPTSIVNKNGNLCATLKTSDKIWTAFGFLGQVNFNNYDGVAITVHTENTQQTGTQLLVGRGSNTTFIVGQGNNEVSTVMYEESTFTTMTNTTTPQTYFFNFADLRQEDNDMGFLGIRLKKGDGDGNVYISKIEVYEEGAYYPGDDYNPGVPCTSITLEPKLLTFNEIDSKEYLSVDVLPVNTTDAITWKSSNEDVATVDSEARVTARGNGSCVITATCGSKSATCNVTVGASIPCTFISMDKTTIQFTSKGATETLNVAVTPENTTDIVKWRSDDTNVATVDNGVVTSVNDGVCNIYATCGSQQTGCQVSVVVPIPCTKITLNKSSLSLAPLGASERLLTTLTPSNTTDIVTWKSSNNNVATVNDIGAVMATGNGSCTITATCGSKSVTCSVTVNTVVPCTSLSLDTNSINFTEVGETTTLRATPTPLNTTDEIGWTSSNTSVATVVDGLITAKGKGNCTITATCGSKSATCSVGVSTNVPCNGITVYPNTITLDANSSATITVSLSPSNTTDNIDSLEITSGNQAVTYTKTSVDSRTIKVTIKMSEKNPTSSSVSFTYGSYSEVCMVIYNYGDNI